MPMPSTGGPMPRRTTHRLVVAAFAVLVSSALASASGAQTVNEEEALTFGRLVIDGAGPVSVTPSGSISCGVHDCLGGHAEAQFLVQGLPLQTYDISYVDGTLDRSGGGGSLDLTNLVDDVSGTLDLGLTGQARFHVGGDIDLGSGDSSGSYSGTYMIFFALQ